MKVINIPQYEGLAVNDLIKFAESEFDIDKFLPEYDYYKEPNRTWLYDLINTIIPEKLNMLVEKKIKERNDKLIASQNLMINAKYEFISIFKNLQSISSLKGKSQYLVRAPKKDQLVIQNLVKENMEVMSKVSKLKKELDILQNKMADYD